MAGKSMRERKRSLSKERRGRSVTPTSSSKKRPRVDLYVELRILLPNKMAGAIIGRKGENIMRLRRSFMANINLPTCKGPERILTITAELSVTCRILADIIPMISTELNGTVGDHVELRLLLHTKQAGAVIGRKGATIKELIKETDSKIKVFMDRCPDSSDQIVQVQGTTRAVIRCIRSILRTIEHVHPPGVSRRYYDPNNFDSTSASRYGGYDQKEPLAIRSQRKRSRKKTSDHDRKTSMGKEVSTPSHSTAADETASISSYSSDPKPSCVSASASDIPSLLSFLSEKEKSNYSQHDIDDADENKHSVSVNGPPYSSVLPAASHVHSFFQVPRLVLMGDRRLNSDRTETVCPVDVRASGPLRDFESSVASVLQSNRSTKDCLDRLLSAVSCLVSSTVSTAEQTTGTYSVANGNANRTTLLVANDNDTAKKNSSGFNDRNRKPVITSQIGIPHDLVGTVFGKGNCRLKFMETMTSTKIWTDDVTDQSSDYVINITGSPEQIGCALELIQSVVKKQTRGPRQR